MDEQLIYRIAEEYILLYTPSAEATRELLPNYEPFLVPELPDGCEPLFTFRGGESLSSDQPKTLLEDKLSEGVRARVYKLVDGQRRLEIATRQGSHAIEVDRDWKEVRSDVLLDDPSAFFFINRLVMIAYGVAIAPKHMLKVHASVTELNGRALIFLGVSGTGKSTHSRLWRQFVPGARLLNDAKLRGRDSFDSIYSSSAFLHSDKVRHLATFDTVADVLERVPVYRLDCRPDEEAVRLTEALLAQSAS